MARWTTSPDTPSVGAAVPDFDIFNWYGAAAPPGTPESVRRLLAEAIEKIVARPEVVRQIERLGSAPATMPPAEFASFVHAELETWRRVVRAANIRAD